MKRGVFHFDYFKQEYQNWLVNYRETEREDQRTHTENDDEKVEQLHENHEVMREQQREHNHNMGRHMIEKRSKNLSYIGNGTAFSLKFLPSKKKSLTNNNTFRRTNYCSFNQFTIGLG